MSHETQLASGQGFLHLGPSVPRHPYEGTHQLWNIKKTKFDAEENQVLDNEWVIFTGIDEKRFAEDFVEASDKMAYLSWSSYDKVQKLLLVRAVKLGAHECAARTFDCLFVEAISSIGLRWELKVRGSASCDNAVGSKRPDCQWRPKKLHNGPGNDWPSGVLEVTLSGSPGKLASDIRYWLLQASSVANFVLAMEIERHRPQITLEKWTRKSDLGSPCREQVITIGNRDGSPIVHGGPLVIEFEKIFGRSPKAQNERDVQVSNSDLEYLANNVWDEQGFPVAFPETPSSETLEEKSEDEE